MSDSTEAKTQSGWTLAKEIYGTLIATLPIIIVLIVWGQSISERIRVIEVRVELSEAADRRREDEAANQRREVLQRIDRLGNQIETLQQSVARLAARSDDATPRRVTGMPTEDSARRGGGQQTNTR